MSNQNLNDLIYKQIENKIEPAKNSEFNPSLTLSYNAAGRIVKIEKTIDGTVYTKTISDDDPVIVSTKIISQWS